MSLAIGMMSFTLKGLSTLLCQIEHEGLHQVPARGPLILVCNHINFLDAPVVISHLQPRPVTGFAKAETWDNPWMGALFSIYGAIPLHRGEADVTALQRGLAVLRQGKILAITPEGTRSGHGRLQKGHPGVITMALHSQAPLLPLVYWGGEAFRDNLRHLRRTPFQIRVGPLLRLDTHGVRVTREIRQAITDELMCQLAALLPPAYRGYYANWPASTHYLQFANLEP